MRVLRAVLAPFLFLVLAGPLPIAAEPPPMSVAYLHDQLVALPMGAEAEQLAERVRAWFGAEGIQKGARAKAEGLEVAWVIDLSVASVPPRIAMEGPGETTAEPMVRIGGTTLYALTGKFAEGAAFRWACRVEGDTRGAGQLELYAVDPDAVENPDVPKGIITAHEKWKSRVFAGTERDWWVYVPAQFKPQEPARVMIFQDGGGMKGYVPAVFDNLIAKGELPVIVGVFINPGHTDPDAPSDGPARPEPKQQRSIEYDTLSDLYARFLLEEILPEVEKTIPLRQDAASRAICGISSGGICSWTVAWERPDAFSKVLSFVGSFTNIASGPTLREGGHNYPALIRKTPKKPIRILLQDGEQDLDNVHGNWPLANQEMARALAFAGYDHKFVYGKGFHSDAHARAIMPSALKWLWRE